MGNRMNHFTVYKITNLVNGKYYIGKHQTKNLNDNYFGSGKLIKSAIKKYGIENFVKEILFVFKTEDEMNKKEAELVTEELIASGSVYNLCPGGQGGFGYINENGLAFGGDPNKARKLGGLGRATKIINDEEFRNKNSKISRENGKKNSHFILNSFAFKGKHHTEEHKKRQSARMKQIVGDKTSQFGTMWITNGTENRKIKKHLDSIPEGWYKGRILNR
jgi:hypothetical protein